MSALAHQCSRAIFWAFSVWYSKSSVPQLFPKARHLARSGYDVYKFTNYTKAQGLPSRQVLDLLETRDGVYWVATGDGLCRFNLNGFAAPQGNATRNKGDAAANPIFVVYSSDEGAATGDISVLFEDHSGAVWLGTSAGLFRLEPSGEQVKFHFVDLGMPAYTSEDRYVMAIAEDQQGGLCGSGLNRYWADGRVEHYAIRDGLPSDGVHSLLRTLDRVSRLKPVL